MVNSSSFNQSSFNVVGVMSGTSLDGLDICLCNIYFSANKWNYRIIRATTIKYSDELKAKLINAFKISGVELTKLDFEYGKWIGQQIKDFLVLEDCKPDFIASHGHTIFHKPNFGYTLQIGKGSAIAAESGLPCICDFRTSDVCRSGQGAPLVPIGDQFLFSEYEICLNLGGFANLSYEKDSSRLAYDIGPCNIILNILANEYGVNFDEKGKLGKKGIINKSLLEDLNALDYYKLKSPKSLGREWIEDVLLPLISGSKINLVDKLRTVYEHIVIQICSITNSLEGKTILATGGGAHNELLIHLLKTKSNKSIFVPDKQTVDFKEAIIFSFLGVLYTHRIPGALSSVTGAKVDSISGCLYF